MPHKWSAEHAGTVRDGWTLRRDCLTCGVEHWVRERPGVLPSVHEYRRSGTVVQVGRHAAPCSDGERDVETAIEISVVGRKWTVRTRPRNGLYQEAAKGYARSHLDAVRVATTWAETTVTGTQE